MSTEIKALQVTEMNLNYQLKQCEAKIKLLEEERDFLRKECDELRRLQEVQQGGEDQT